MPKVMQLTLYKNDFYIGSKELAENLGREHRFVVSQLGNLKNDLSKSAVYGRNWARVNMKEFETTHKRNGLPAKDFLLSKSAALIYAERLRPTEKRAPLEKSIIETFKNAY